jgi:hypothetical protein
LPRSPSPTPSPSSQSGAAATNAVWSRALLVDVAQDARAPGTMPPSAVAEPPKPLRGGGGGAIARQPSSRSSRHHRGGGGGPRVGIVVVVAMRILNPTALARPLVSHRPNSVVLRHLYDTAARSRQKKQSSDPPPPRLPLAMGAVGVWQRAGRAGRRVRRVRGVPGGVREARQGGNVISTPLRCAPRRRPPFTARRTPLFWILFLT